MLWSRAMPPSGVAPALVDVKTLVVAVGVNKGVSLLGQKGDGGAQLLFKDG